MYRTILEDLKSWKENQYRKPLILKGARQVGKTHIVKEFGTQCYEDVAYFNFEKNDELKKIFADNLDPARILSLLSLSHGKAINPRHNIDIFR